MRAADLRSDASLTEVRPRTVGDLHGPTLVRTGQTLAMGAVGTEGEPERVFARAVMNIRLDLGTTRLAVGLNAVKAIGQQINVFAPEDDDGQKPGTGKQRVGVVADEDVVDGRPHLGTGIGDETIERENLAHGNTRLRIGRQSRRGIRNRHG